MPTIFENDIASYNEKTFSAKSTQTDIATCSNDPTPEEGPKLYPSADKLPQEGWTTDETVQCPACLNVVLASHLEGSASPIAKKRIDLKFVDYTSKVDASPSDVSSVNTFSRDVSWVDINTPGAFDAANRVDFTEESLSVHAAREASATPRKRDSAKSTLSKASKWSYVKID